MTSLRTLPLIGALAAAAALAGPAAAAPSLGTPGPEGATRATEIQISAPASADAACARADVIADGSGATQEVELARADASVPYNASVAGLAEGGYRLKVFAWDAVGCVARDISSATSVQVRFVVDRTAPEPFSYTSDRTGCAPVVGGLVRSAAAAPQLCWGLPRDVRSEVASVAVVIDGVTRSELALGPSSTRAMVSGLTEGLHSLAIIATDSAGNTRLASGASQIQIDRTAPSLAWTRPAPKVTWVRRRVALSVRSADAGAGLSRLVFSSRPRPADGSVPTGDLGRIDVPSGTAADQVFLNTATLADGRYQWGAYATDLAGNVAVALRVVQVDNTSPRFSRRSGKVVTVRGRGVRRALVRVSDAASPQVRTAIVIRRGSKTLHRSPAILARDTDVQKITIPARVPSGDYRLVVQVKDLAGNLASKAFTLRVRRG